METIESDNFIDWHSEKNNVLISPFLLKEDQSNLKYLYIEINKIKKIQGHIWIASSGSSRKKNESLKLIALSKKAFLISAVAVNEHLQSNSSDIWIQVLPRFHVGGLSIEARAYKSGATVVEGLINGKWNPEKFLSIILKNKATLSALVPTQVFDLVQAQVPAPPRLRAIVVGGAALSEDLYIKARRLGWPLLPSYGLTECCSQVATAELKSLVADGFPNLKILKHCEVQVTDEGLLKIRSQALLTGYAQMINEEVGWYEPIVNNWYLTSDRAQISNSYLSPQGRVHDYIKINGEGVSLLKLREILEQVVQEISATDRNKVTLMVTENMRSGFELSLVHESQVAGEIVEKIQLSYNTRVTPVERLLKVVKVNEISRSALGKVLHPIKN